MMKNHQKILMYHSVGSQESSEIGAELYSVPVDKFREQMNYVVHSPQSTVHSQVLITFDDGDVTNYTTAFPILKEFGLKAYFFILTSKVGKEGFLNWSQIKELSDTGMIIGSHGITHRLLTELSDNELDYELSESRKILEDNLKQPVEYFSIPRGFCNKNIEEAAKKAGYKAIFTSDIKDNNGFIDNFKTNGTRTDTNYTQINTNLSSEFIRENPCAIRENPCISYAKINKFGRIPVKRDWSLAHFKSVLSNGLSPKEKIEEFVKRITKEFLGARVYDKIRTKILKKT